MVKPNYDEDNKLIKKGIQIYFQNASNYELLSLNDEHKLGERIQNNDFSAVNELVVHNLRLAVDIAKRYAGFAKSLDLDDLIQSANIGLIKAAQRYDYTKGGKFSTYAKYWIKLLIVSEIQKNDLGIRLPANVFNLVNKVNNAIKKLTMLNGYEPSNEEIANYLNLDILEVELAKERDFDISSSSVKVSRESEVTIEDNIIDDDMDVEKIALEYSLKKDVYDVLNSLDKREKEILILYYGLYGNDEHILEEISPIYKVSRERIRQIKAEAIEHFLDNVKGRNLAEYIDLNPSDFEREKRVECEISLYDLLSDITLNKNIIKNHINFLPKKYKKIIYIMYGKDLDNPMKDENSYNEEVEGKFYSEVLPEIRRALSKDYTSRKYTSIRK